MKALHPMIQSYPLSAQNAYRDLLRRHQTAMIDDLGGSPYIVEAEYGRRYWYTKTEIGGRAISRYLGPDTTEMREWIDDVREKRQDASKDRKQRSVIVRMLRQADYPTLDRETGKVLFAMAKVGVFRLGGTLVGTHAFALYPAELGVVFNQALQATEDIDVAQFQHLSVALGDQVDPALNEALGSLGLERTPHAFDRARSASYRMRTGGTAVDFLAPLMGADSDELIHLPALGEYAHPFRFLDYLIDEPIHAIALYRDGVLVQIPRPERFAMHKLIIANRRSGAHKSKRTKDLAQAHALLQVLVTDRPDDVVAAYEEAVNRGKNWKAEIDISLSAIDQLVADEVRRLIDQSSCASIRIDG